MTDAQVEAELLSRYAVRAGPAVVRYVAEQVARAVAERGAFPILVGCARTGRPMRQVVVPAELAATATATATAAE